MFLRGEGGEEAEVGFGGVVRVWTAGLCLEVPEGAETREEWSDAPETPECLRGCRSRITCDAVFWRERRCVGKDERRVDFSFRDEFGGGSAGFSLYGDGEDRSGG